MVSAWAAGAGVKIRYRWTGTPDEERPMLGHHLASARGRNAYLILAIDDRGYRETGQQQAHTLLVLTVERCSRAVLQDRQAVVWGIVWHSRTRAKRLRIGESATQHEQ